MRTNIATIIDTTIITHIDNHDLIIDITLDTHQEQEQEQIVL